MTTNLKVINLSSGSHNTAEIGNFAWSVSPQRAMIVLAQLLRANVHKCPSLCLDWIKAIVSIIGVPLTIWTYTHLLPYIAQSFPVSRVGVTCRRGNWDDFFCPSDKIFHSNTGNSGFTENCEIHICCWQYPSLQWLLFQLYCRLGLTLLFVL